MKNESKDLTKGQPNLLTLLMNFGTVKHVVLLVLNLSQAIVQGLDFSVNWVRLFGSWNKGGGQNSQLFRILFLSFSSFCKFLTGLFRAFRAQKVEGNLLNRGGRVLKADGIAAVHFGFEGVGTVHFRLSVVENLCGATQLSTKQTKKQRAEKHTKKDKRITEQPSKPRQKSPYNNTNFMFITLELNSPRRIRFQVFEKAETFPGLDGNALSSDNGRKGSSK